MTMDDRIPIKPFLSPVPEVWGSPPKAGLAFQRAHAQVEVLDLSSLDCMDDRAVLVVASDGLWDVLSNDEVADIVNNALAQATDADPLV